MTFPIYRGAFGITVEVILDSVHPRKGTRLTTLRMRAPRAIHAETLRYRAWSVCAGSSRAIPAKRKIGEVWRTPFRPSFAANRPGMRPGARLAGFVAWWVAAWWWLASRFACVAAWCIAPFAHKQWVNRILEPFAYITTIVTSTSWDNMIRQRMALAPDGTPYAHEEFFELARLVKLALHEHEPTPRTEHFPFLTAEEARWPDAPYVSAMRCARVSLELFPNTTFAGDVEKGKSLATQHHWSPFEHVARTGNGPCRNFVDWIQFRAVIDGDL